MPPTSRQRKAGGKYVIEVLNYSLYLYRRDKMVGIYARLSLPAETLCTRLYRRLQLNMTKTTNIYLPKSAIEKSILNCIWQLTEHDLCEREEIILPKGTIELIFNFSDKVNYNNPYLKISKILPTVFVNGINFKPFRLAKAGRQEFFGIQLNSIGLRQLFKLSVWEFNDVVHDASSLFPCLTVLADELKGKQNFMQRVEMILKWIFSETPELKSHNIVSRVQKLQHLSRHDNITVKKLSSEISLSDRQLRRFSLDWLGMTTEEFILYNKYLLSLQLLHNSKQTLTEIGLEAGYYDQSHFIREFKSYTGHTPSQYRKANKGIPGHIYL